MITDREYKKKMDSLVRRFKFIAITLTAISLSLAEIQKLMVTIIEKFR